MTTDVQARFMARVRITETGCWEWTGKPMANGYCRTGAKGFGLERPYDLIHRISWRIFKGRIPKGIFVLHDCDNRPCGNPDHLFLGTHADNMADCKAKGRTAFRKGEANPGAMLTDEMIAAIRASKLSAKTLAKQMGCSVPAVSVARRGLSWDHIGGAAKLPPSFKVFFDGHEPREAARELVRRYEAGETSINLAASYGVTKVTILQALRKLGVAMRPSGNPAHEVRVNGNTYPSVQAAMRGERLGFKALKLAMTVGE